MVWHELLFMHWRVEPQAVQRLLPDDVRVQTHGGAAWVGVVPFRMSGVRARGLPPPGPLAAFAELNVRTYVEAGGKPGVWFFSLDVPGGFCGRGGPALAGARRAYRLNYQPARMSTRREGEWGEWVAYASRRLARSVWRAIGGRDVWEPRANPAPAGAELAARYRAEGPVFRARPGSLESFLTDRYCLYAADAVGRVVRAEIHHAPWPLRAGVARVEKNTMLEAVGIDIAELERRGGPALLHYAERIETVAWPARAIG